MKYNVLVIAGTTESRQVIEKLLDENPDTRILASVATELGKEMLLEYGIDIHVGRLDYDGFLTLFKENPCGKIMDASHPFARIVSETVKKAAQTAGISYERYERRNLQYSYEGIVHVKDVQEAISLLNELEGNIFLTTGVNTAAAYMTGVRDGAERLYIRVLDNISSLEGCAKAGYQKDHVFGKMPPFTVEDNVKLIKETNAEVLVSKDSGKTGGVDIKVEACRQTGIKMILIDRPR